MLRPRLLHALTSQFPRSAGRRRTRKPRTRLKARFERLEDRRLLAVVVWDGDTDGDTDGDGDGVSWADEFNWSGDVAPTAADDVTIDVAGDIVVLLSGAPVTINSLTSQEGIIIDTGSALSVSVGGLVNGTFDNSGTIEVLSGELVLGDYTQSAGTTSLNGGDIAGQLDIDGGELVGMGMVFGSVLSSGNTRPGPGIGSITITDGYVQGMSGELEVEFGSTGNDHLTVNDSVTLNGVLNVSLSDGFTPSAGDLFTIIDNTGSDAVDGTFIGFPEGAPLSVGTTSFEITYTGGIDGNDVVLTALVQIVDIDVKPDDDINTVNLAANGVLPVAIYTTTDFDASTIDVSSVTFAGAFAQLSALEDVDGDGDLDLVLHFRIQDMADLQSDYLDALIADLEDGVLDDNHQDVTVTLRGQTNNGTTIEGFDTIDAFFAGRALREVLANL
jgi:hypothetical protein